MLSRARTVRRGRAIHDISITRWTRYGHDRGYATAADGTKLGWINLNTGDVTLEDGVDAAAVGDALVAWSAALSNTRPPTPVSVPFDVLQEPEPSDVEQEPPRAVVEPVTADEAFATLPDIEPREPNPAPVPPVEQIHSATRQWTDLAAHRPGQLVHDQAAAKWEADKADSKLFAYGARLFDIKTQERAWRVGAKGEAIVGNRLQELESRGWRILHAVPVGKKGSDIDHVAIGPGGVFTVNTKRHPRAKVWIGRHQIRVNGTPTDYLRNSRFEATRASKKLSAVVGSRVRVTPCIVLSGAPTITVKQRPDDVIVVASQDVPRWFKKRPDVLTREQIEAIYAVARRSDTWT
ncbi:NERD domain-containing protein [Demequina sp.]|uniref:NERD domain-containing protein n=1 Tax=Demequina sp. TaxID=2050685 RepID=UPI0025BD65A7|nr:NERD domain-containing protein [Demequina sp.]